MFNLPNEARELFTLPRVDAMDAGTPRGAWTPCPGRASPLRSGASERAAEVELFTACETLTPRFRRMFCSLGSGRGPERCCSYRSVNCSAIRANVVSGADQCAPKPRSRGNGPTDV